MAETEAYGSAHLFKEGGETLEPIYTYFAEKGCLAVPLGNNSGDFNMGEIYHLHPDGMTKGHALTFGRTRGGKGVSSIIPALLTYSGSMVVIDPKGENAWLTAERRRAMGHRVVILDPWNEVNRRYGSKAGIVEPITKFNPLSFLDPDDPDFADDIAALADSLILRSGNDPHWPDSARELVGGLMAAEVQHRPGKAALRSVRKLLTAPIDQLTTIIRGVIDKYPGSVAAKKLATVVEAGGNEREASSIRSTARTQTAFLDSARLLDAMETDELPFDLSDIANKWVTLYLVLPVDRLATHGRWLRLIVTLAIRAIAKANSRPVDPVLFLLDELGTISPGSGLSMVEQSYGLMAGLGIRIWAFLQDLPQLKRDYPDSWETFISNSSIIQLLNVADNTTAKYFSEYMGNGTLNAKTGSWTYKQVKWESEEERKRFAGPRMLSQGNVWSDPERTANYKTEWTPDMQLISRPVMFPWEIINADANKTIILSPGLHNVQLDRIVYYTHPQLRTWFRPDPNRA